MPFNKAAIVVVNLLFLATAPFAQNSGLEKIDREDLKRHLTFLSSDSLQGRMFGTEIPGLDIAAAYIASIAKETGLKPGAENYFQKLEVVHTQPGKNGFVELHKKNGKSTYHSKSIISLGEKPRVIDLKNEAVVVAGFGSCDTTLGYDDLKGIDIGEKIVVVAQGCPSDFKKGNVWGWKNSFERAKIERISEKNPKAIVIVTNPQDKEKSTFLQISRWSNRDRYSLKTSGNDHDKSIVLLALPEFADALLKGKYEKYLSGITRRDAPNSFPVEGITMNMEMKGTTQPVETKNVVGVVEGGHPELKNEYLVIMAHYDHLGIDKNGDVYNGADDNASGTATLLEVAEAFMVLEEKPKRSIVFLWVTAEEVGMLGSQFYAENPIFPLEKTVACINIDMAGRVFEPRDTVWDKSPKKVKDFDGLYTLTNEVWPELKTINSAVCKKLGLIPDYSLPSNFLRSSDHYHFHRNGVPVINYATGYHADYHKVTDEVSRINFDKMKRVADLCFLVGLEIANQ